MSTTTIAGWGLRALVVAGLGVDAYTHADLASRYAGLGSSVTQGQLFWLETGVVCMVALIVLVAGNRIWALALGALAGAGSLAALLIYRYVNVGALGPFPAMYEPLWYPEKVWSGVGETVALVAAVAGIAVLTAARQRHRQPVSVDRRP